MGLLFFRRASPCQRLSVCVGLGIGVILICSLIIIHQQEKGFPVIRAFDVYHKTTGRSSIVRQESSESPPIIPISASKTWSFVYGENGCPKNQWRHGLVKLFEEWTNIASKNAIEYVLTCGSLLGALRTGDVIPYDSDMDILVNIKYYNQLKKLSTQRNFDPYDGKIRLVLQPEFERNVSTEARKRYTCSGKLTPTMVDVCSFQDPMARLIRKYLQIDIYPLYDKGETLLDTTDGDIRTYKKRDMFPLRPCKMMGFDSFCPQNPWNILQAYYRTKKFEPTYKCKGKAWVDRNGRRA